ncbi:E3 ubiquitin-protein ligase DCST1 [Fundulus heteroclitus]|uniref:E3 ubiquitin-protein ligase DCST1 n=1 Tax=Fundulus heteroclitus TaxID=8078 RepID=UPI00165BE659|nr:E3 ubiquitin-protein ligase DCST1 [Fundulus heteroclitus]
MFALPPAVRRFSRLPAESPAALLVLRGLLGAVSGAVLFLGIVHNFPLTFVLKLAVGSVFVGVCVAGGALSSSFRCTVLLTLPSILGSRGRSYLMVLVVMVMFRGPIANIERNAEGAALSLSCNLDLQVHHSRMLWRQAIRPFILVTQQLMDDKAEFESESLNISRKFQNIRDEVLLQYGYDPFQPKPKPGGRANSTQEQFTAKTRMQCDGVVSEGIQRCADWFAQRWEACMEAIPVPVINHILCVSMKFHFLCDVMRIMTPWCREQIPVEGNFGRLFDQLNVSVERLSREFRTEVVVQEEEQQPVLDGVLLDQAFTQAVRRSFQNLTRTMEQVMNVLQLLLSFTFITVFIQAFQYLCSYRRNIMFDNLYITSYFRRIDDRRRRAGKRFLLPLRKSERKAFIAPTSLKIFPQELKQVTPGAFQVLSILLLSVVLLAVDSALVRVLDIISRHTFTQFNVTSGYHVDIKVGGDSMMARLLRTTISGFNSSSELNVHSDNRACMSPPTPLPAEVYVSCVGCILLVALFSCLQVYTNRLRRLIAAFYHPKREKKRVLFLYNLQLHRRTSSPDRTASRGQSSGTVFQHLGRWRQRLLHHRRQGASELEEAPCV